MGIDYHYNVGYGFLLSMDDNALPAEWDDRELWYTGDLYGAISGSGLTSIVGGNYMSGPLLWGFMATETLGRMSASDSPLTLELRDIDPTVVGNLFDIRARVKRPSARVGWTMWADIS